MGAQENDRVGVAGHIERFNPAVLELDRQVSDLLHMQLTRIGAVLAESHNVVVLDLMRSTTSTCSTLWPHGRRRGSRRPARADEDLVTALLRFTNGVTATATASRVGPRSGTSS